MFASPPNQICRLARSNTMCRMVFGPSAAMEMVSVDDRGRIWLAETGVQPNRLVAFDPATKAFTETIPIAADGPNTIRHMVFDRASRQIGLGGDANRSGRLPGSAPALVP